MTAIAGGRGSRRQRQVPTQIRHWIDPNYHAHYSVVGALNYIAPLDSTAILLVAGPIMALGWLMIGLAWFRVPQPAASAPA